MRRGVVNAEGRVRAAQWIAATSMALAAASEICRPAWTTGARCHLSPSSSAHCELVSRCGGEKPTSPPSVPSSVVLSSIQPPKGCQTAVQILHGCQGTCPLLRHFDMGGLPFVWHVGLVGGDYCSCEMCSLGPSNLTFVVSYTLSCSSHTSRCLLELPPETDSTAHQERQANPSHSLHGAHHRHQHHATTIHPLATPDIPHYLSSLSSTPSLLP